MGIHGRSWPRLAALAAALGCLLPVATASARPGDVPAELLKPAAGAVVQDATGGLALDFTCPAYHEYLEDDVITGPVDGYHVVLATAPDVDEHGMLLTSNVVDQRDAVGLDPAPGSSASSHCTAADDDAGRGLLPREPGTYWWQVYRECMTYVCPGGVEPSDPAQVTVVRTVCTVQRALLQQAQRSLTSARRQLRHHRTRARRARVARLSDRVAILRARVRVAYRCRPS